MFNLLVVGGRPGMVWSESGAYEFPPGREHEYSDKDKSVSVYLDNIERRKDLPCLFAYEGFDGFGRVGHIRSIAYRGPRAERVEVAYALDRRFPEIPIHDEETYAKFGCRDWECNRTHWAVKNIDLFETVAELLASNVPDVEVSQATVNRIWGGGSRARARVFLSHRAEDRKSVSMIAEGLGKLGHRTFVAHDDIQATREWRDEILHALKTMTHFVGIVTDGFHDGSWTDQEVGCAFARADVKRIFVKLSNSDPKGFAGFEQAATSDWASAAERIAELMDDNR